MSTAQRIQRLSRSGQSPQLLGSFSASELSEWVKCELGHADALDNFHPHGPILSKAEAPTHLLHIVSGNTPHAALQTLLRGLLIGSHNTVKLPSSGLPELEQWVKQLDPELKQKIELHSQLNPHHWQRANTVVAIGSDSSIEAIHRQLRPDQGFIPHGHKVSIGIIHDDFAHAAERAARDVSLYNQRGCLSPHCLYVKETTPGDARKFADMLAGAMQAFALKHPPEPLTLSEAGSVRTFREVHRFESANTPDVALWESDHQLDWTIVFNHKPQIQLSCLNRCVYVKPLPDQIDCEKLGSESHFLSSLAIHPFSTELAASLSHLPAHRYCPLGQSQQPSLFWHHDGFAPLASLVSWKDLG